MPDEPGRTPKGKRGGKPRGERRPVLNDFGPRLVEARTAAGYPTPADAARHLGWAYRRYFALENGEKIPRWDTAKAVIVGLKLDVTRFFPELAQRKPKPKK